MISVRVKICGIKTPEIADSVIENGADAVGFVFYDKSPRFIKPEKAGEIISNLPPFINRVGVFVDKDIDEILEIVKKTGIDTIQLHGEPFFYDIDFVTKLKERTGLPVVLAVRTQILNEETVSNIILSDHEGGRIVNAYLIDRFDPEQFGGTGTKVSISNLSNPILKEFIAKKVILSGGINASNVMDILKSIQPYGIDVSSGVEKERGVKDPDMIRNFMGIVKRF